MANSGYSGLTRVIKATQFSWQGVCAAYRHEEAFRQEVWLSIILIPLGLYLGETRIEKALLVAAVIQLPLVEILNSAIEAVVDRFGGEQHELSGRAKDMGSAAVMLSIALLASVWGIILLLPGD